MRTAYVKSFLSCAIFCLTLSAQATPTAPLVDANDKYSYVDPQHIVPTTALKNALAYWDSNKSKIKNQNFMTVIDYTQKSTKERFYMIDMRSGQVETFLTAHGRGSDPDHDGYATIFSNTSGSEASSLGFFLTAETYSGHNGYSLRLDGLSSTNSNARDRAIVIHGASYVDPNLNPIGRSWGCPALEIGVRTRVINLLQGGSLIYSYHATKM